MDIENAKLQAENLRKKINENSIKDGYVRG